MIQPGHYMRAYAICVIIIEQFTNYETSVTNNHVTTFL